VIVTTYERTEQRNEKNNEYYDAINKSIDWSVIMSSRGWENCYLFPTSLIH